MKPFASRTAVGRVSRPCRCSRNATLIRWLWISILMTGPVSVRGLPGSGSGGSGDRDPAQHLVDRDDLGEAEGHDGAGGALQLGRAGRAEPAVGQVEVGCAVA